MNEKKQRETHNEQTEETGEAAAATKHRYFHSIEGFFPGPPFTIIT